MRIQILPLPSVMVGDDLAEPFALVVDQCRYDDPNLMSPLVAEAAQGRWKRFAEECGARTVLVTDETVEIVDRFADPDPARVRVEEMHIHTPKDVDAEKIARGWPRLQRDRSEDDE